MSFNLLDISSNFIDFAVDLIDMKNLNWIGKIIQWLIEGIGIIGVGVIVFTLILKTITLPLDIYSRTKMKKQSLIMKTMRPQMEKLQQQYANDQAMYNQKVMELQKKNGISMISACVPMIITLVIFMVVFSAFSTYSQYANLSTYNDMVGKYNTSVQTYVLKDFQENQLNSDGFLIEYLDESLIDYKNLQLDLGKINLKTLDLDNIDLDLYSLYTGEENLDKLKEKQFNSLKAELEKNLLDQITKAKAYYVDFDAFTLAIKDDIGFNSDYIKELYKQLYNLENVPANTNIEEEFGKMNEDNKMFFVRNFVRENARKASADHYRENKSSFLWVNNIWYPDSPLNKEVPKFADFSKAISRALGTGLDTTYETSYDEVTYYLRNSGYENENGKLEGNKVNGYFVLIVLAIGLMFLQQFVTMRVQKDANELSTVNGTGAKTNKWMLVLMPLIYGIFSFFYSAAFSLYMITNTIYGFVTTLIINKVMDKKYAKWEANGGFEKKRADKNNRKRLK